MRLWDCHAFIHFIKHIHFSFGSKFEHKVFCNIHLFLLHFHYRVQNCLCNTCQDTMMLYLRTESPWSQCSFYIRSISARKKKKKNTHAHYKQFELLGILILENCLTWWLVLYLIHSAIPDWSETLITAIVVLNAFSNCFFNFIQKFLNLEWG